MALTLHSVHAELDTLEKRQWDLPILLASEMMEAIPDNFRSLFDLHLNTTDAEWFARSRIKPLLRGTKFTHPPMARNWEFEIHQETARQHGFDTLEQLKEEMLKVNDFWGAWFFVSSIEIREVRRSHNQQVISVCLTAKLRPDEPA